MAEIVNLRQRRKQQARERAEQGAAENRARFGRPKAARRHEAAEDARQKAELDSKKLTDG
jgi:Domain of unknown function (DUF4169)